MQFRRITPLLFSLCACASALAQVATPGSSFVFQLPGPESGLTRFLGYQADTGDLTSDIDANGPINLKQIVATPDGQRLYLIGDGPLQVVNTNFTSFQILNAVQGPIRKAVMTPNGRYLLVLAQQFYILDTTNNQVVATNLGVTGPLVDVAVTADSRRAYLLQDFSFSGSITPINLTNFTAGTRVDIPVPGANIALSPLGRLFVSSGNRISEYNPQTLALIADISVLATPGPMRFTPDGSRMYFVNRTPTIGGRAIVSIRLADRVVTDWPPFNPSVPPPNFEDVYIASNERILAWDRSQTTLWEIGTSPLSGTPLNIAGVLQANKVYGVALSQEYPAARFLYVLTESGNQFAMKRIALATNSTQVESGLNSVAGIFTFVAIPPQAGVSNFIKFNDNQIVPGGGATLPLLARLTDALGRPVFGQPVSFTALSATGVVIGTPETTSNSEGFVQTSVTLPAEPGVYNVLLTAGSMNTTFTLTVPGPGGGLPGGPPRLIISRGDGQLIPRGFFSNLELVAQALDVNGRPEPGVRVTFTVAEGLGSVTSFEEFTDEQGLIRARYTAPGFFQGRWSDRAIIRAESAFGSVDFTAVYFNFNPDGSGAPKMDTIKPTFNQVEVPVGDVIQDFYVVQIRDQFFPQTGQPVQGVGLRVATDVPPYIEDGPGRCVNDTKSDNLGIARCHFQASCSLQSNVPIRMRTGEWFGETIFLIARPGTAQKLTIVSGNNQSGNAGQPLGSVLTARVTDNCDNPVAGQQVTWTVIQGSATITSQVNTSNALGLVTASITLGPNPGPVQVRATLANRPPVVFTITNNVVVSSITLLSGGGQSAVAGQPFANPVVFVVRDPNGNPVGAGVPVTFSVSGSGSINPVSTNTDAQGRVQTLVTAGSTSGPLTITASHGAVTASAVLSVVPPGLNLTPAMFTNAASGAVGLVPCGLATLVAPGLAPGVNGVVSGVGAFGPLPYQLATIQSIRVNGIPAPIQAVANQGGREQVNFQVPCEVQPGFATVIVNVNGSNNTVNLVPVFQGQPGIFTYAGPDNKRYGAVIRLRDGSYITPSNLAPTGESFWVILTGLGQTSPALTTNSPGLPGQAQTVNLESIVGVNNGGVPAQPAKYLPGSIGVYYIEFTIPKTSTAPPGTVLGTDVPLAVAVVVNGQAVFGNPVLLPGIVQGQ
jgi:uncharacterized protein (TIGR03437 family)